MRYPLVSSVRDVPQHAAEPEGKGRKVEKLKILYEAGMLTDEDYAKAKMELMLNI